MGMVVFHRDTRTRLSFLMNVFRRSANNGISGVS